MTKKTTQTSARGQIFFYTGEESFLLREKIRQMKKATEEKYGEFNTLFVNFDLPSAGVSDYLNKKTKEVSAELMTPSFFGDKRVVYLDNFPLTSQSKKLPKGIDKYLMRTVHALENLPEENVAILISENPDKRTKVFKTLKKLAVFENFEKLHDQKLQNWIRQRIAAKNGQIKPTAIKFLAEYCGNDLWKINQEINKLISFKENDLIDEQDIQLLCLPNAEIVNFALSNALQNRKLNKALQILQNEIEAGKSPQEILFRDLATILRQILAASYGLAKNLSAKELGMNPWLFNNWKKAAGKIDFQEAKKAFSALLLIDEGIKTGKIEISPSDTRMFSLVIESFLLEFFNENKIEFKKPLLRK